MVQSQAVFGSSGASSQVTVAGAPTPPISYLIIGGIALLGIVIVAVILKK